MRERHEEECCESKILEHSLTIYIYIYIYIL